MRICLYTETAFPIMGGQEVVVDHLARQYLQMGHEPIVLAPYPKRLKVDDSSFPYRVVRHPRFYSNRYFVGWYRHWLLKFQKAYPCDIWHCHSVYPCGYVASLAAQYCRVPIVITSHGGDIRLGNIRLRKPGLEARFQQAVAAADALVAISDFTATGYCRLYPAAQNIVPIPNGVDLDPFVAAAARPGQLPAEIQPNRYLLFIGRLRRQKGVDVLLNAMTRIPPNGDVEVVVAGDGPERVKLEEQTRQSGLAGRVRFVGMTTGPSKTWLLQNARALVVPSRTWESFGLVVLEGYAAGRPVIASRLPGLGDLIEPERTGLLVPPESPGELAIAVSRLLNDSALASCWGQHAQAKAQHFGWPEIAKKHLELYERLSMRHRIAWPRAA